MLVITGTLAGDGSHPRSRLVLRRQTEKVQSNYRAICTVWKAGYLCLALCFLFSSAYSPNRSPLSPALFLSPLNCFPGLGCSAPAVGLPGGRIRHPPSAVVALAALAGAGPGGLAFAGQRIPVLRMVQPRLLALVGVGGIRASAVEDKPIRFVMRCLCTLSARWSILTVFSGF